MLLYFFSSSIYSDEFMEFEEFTELKRLLDDSSVLLWRAKIEEQESISSNTQLH